MTIEAPTRRTDSSRFAARRLLLACTAAVAFTGLACVGQAIAEEEVRPSGVMLAGSSDSAVGDAVRIAASPELVNASTLKRRAIDAARDGQLDETRDLLTQALQLRPDDPSLRQMDAWVADFQEQREAFAADRKEAFERQVADVKVLRDNGFRSHAIRAAHGAASLADDEQAFKSQAWVRDLIVESEKLGLAYEENGQWLKAMRVWADLAGIEGQEVKWSEGLKRTQRHVRLLATYVPEHLSELREETQEELEAVDKVLADARQEPDSDIDDPDVTDGEAGDADDAPATRPGTEDAEILAEEFKRDWRDSVEGITMTMLRDALKDARQYHVRESSMQTMLLGGIDALDAVATTRGLEAAFASLDDAEARDRFRAGLADLRMGVEVGDDADDGDVSTLLRSLTALNNRTIQLPDEVLVSEFADGSMSELDPFTAVIWPSQVAEFRKSTSGSFVGVGIKIRAEQSGDLRVVSPLLGGPAIESGIKYGDVITHIDGKSANGINDSDAVKVITGEPGTEVTLTIRTVDGDVTDHTLVRREIDVRSITGWRQRPGGGWDWLADEESNIGYLRLTNFQKNTAEELSDALVELEAMDVRGIVLDLRYNPGGLLGTAVEVSDQFLTGREGNGEIVSTRGERNVVRRQAYRASRSRDDVRVPMVVLVNGYSASASEIVSGALKDNGRALVVGERTFGKGSVQMLFNLGSRGAEAWLKLTTSHYYLPSGRNIHKEELDTEWGVDPDVVVQMTPTQARDAILARQALDVLRDDGTAATVKVDDEDQDAMEVLLDSDAQLSAALLLLRMQLASDAV
ncbi:MAG: S41 family peptidase [Planctomycetota bacterium]